MGRIIGFAELMACIGLLLDGAKRGAPLARLASALQRSRDVCSLEIVRAAYELVESSRCKESSDSRNHKSYLFSFHDCDAVYGELFGPPKLYSTTARGK